MSIIESLRKLVDPVQARAEAEEQRSLREEPKREDATGGAPPALFRCRVCGLEDDDGAYCKRCLAVTMKRVQPGASRS